MKRLTIKVRPKVDVYCGAGGRYDSGNAIFPFIRYVDLGTDIGFVQVELTNTLGSPVKMKVYLEDSLVIDTGYLGETFRQQALDDFNSNNGYPQENIIQSSPGATTTHYFNKTSSANQVAKVECYAPLSLMEDSPNKFNFVVKCPNPNI